MKNQWLLLVLMSFLGCASPSEKTPNNPGVQKEEVVKVSPFQLLLDSLFEAKPALKGVSMHIESPDRNISWTGAAGFADSATNRLLKPSDPVLIASTTKLYMSAITLKLVENGLFKLSDPIKSLLSKKTTKTLMSDGYDLEKITIAHLLSNTSGFYDYVNTKTFMDRTQNDLQHEWTRDEQIALAVSEGDPVGKPGETFSYSDVNFLLIGEIIEQQTGMPFYTAMRNFLDYEKHNLNHTWFNLLEATPGDLAPLTHQFATKLNSDSYTLHGSFDLYGGGGIAATPKDVARFSQALFNGKLFTNPETIELIFTNIETQDSVSANYYMGVKEIEIGNYKAYGHGGFWGTTVQYIPALNTSVSVFLMERDQWPVYLELMEDVVEILAETHSPNSTD